MRRHKLLCLEMLGLVQEVRDCGYVRAYTSDGVNEIPPSGDPLADERLKLKMIKKLNELRAEIIE